MHYGQFFKVFLIIGGISLLLDWYVFSGLRTLTRDWSVVWAKHLLIFGYLFISVLITVMFLSGARSFSTAQGMRPFHEYLLTFFITFLITKLVFVIIISLGDLGRFLYGIGDNLFGKKHIAGQPYFPGRRKFISELGILIAAFPFFGFMYAIFRGKYDYKLHKVTLYFEDLPKVFDGFTVTQISDIHSGSFDNREAVQRGVALAQDQKSDLFVFTGDLVNNAAFEIEPYISDFSKLRAPFGQFSTLGNHDYGDYIDWPDDVAKAANLEKLKKHHQELGYRLLMDEHVELEKNGQKITLIGVQNWGRGFIQLGDLDKALKGVDPGSFKILLSHDPTHWEEKVRFNQVNINLTLAGHTHGAQFGIETAGFRWSPVQYRYLDWAGLGHHNERYIYVNRGFGFLAFSGRLGIWPEITVITLKKKKADVSDLSRERNT